ncbi:MAG: hypothetical protein MMC23_004699 [Stictis urceolatum]|nr:hypothetical protein [Stictis urceolata]
MLIRGTKRRVLLLAPVLFVLFIGLSFFNESVSPTQVQEWIDNFKAGGPVIKQSEHSIGHEGDVDSTRNELFSVSTPSKKYFNIDFGDQEAINPNIIPHPSLKETWIVVAQLQRSDIQNTIWFAELVCNAAFKDGALKCLKAPIILPIAATTSGIGKCQGNIEHFSMNVGPHDARAFFGPKAPYTMYGSNSAFTCFGQWIQDLRVLTDWGYETIPENHFKMGTEIQRPPPYQEIEKNWFIFWDRDDKMYAHYDVWPKRVYAQLSFDGSVGPDLAPAPALFDQQCMSRLMPPVNEEPFTTDKHESIHQATNSLAITLCKRSDPKCKPNDENTLVFTIFQHKKFYQFHPVYEPYVFLFKRKAPFDVYAIGQKPIWIHGRGRNLENGQTGQNAWDGTELFYITSISWKKQGLKYHGFIDDELFLGFGVEDKRSAGIDIVAGDLFLDLGFCHKT